VVEKFEATTEWSCKINNKSAQAALMNPPGGAAAGGAML